MSMQKALLIVNTGTPDDPGKKSVRKYLSEFLNDPRVIDLPWLARKILVNLIIVPFRASHSAELYQRLWTPDGSPLRINLEKLVFKLQEKLKQEYTVTGSMRYGNPSLRSALNQIRDNSVKELTVLPLYPQYASSTTGSVRNLLIEEIRKWPVKPEVRFIDQFYSHPSFIDAFAARIRHYRPEKFDHLLFSYHSLPVKHIRKVHPENDYLECTCMHRFPEYGKYCYRATCYETSRLLSAKLSLREGTFSTSFQSRLSKNWMGPFTDKVLLELVQKGKKKILIAAPSFVSDCFETTIEISEGYRNVFMNNGGENLVLVESLNDGDEWVEAVLGIIDKFNGHSWSFNGHSIGRR